MLMAPLVRRSWAPRGHTPILYQRTRAHKKVSVIAAICIPPTRDRVHLYFRLHPDENINGSSVSVFLKNLSRHLNKPAILVWDRFKPHRSLKVKSMLSASASFHPEFLPPYAPELNPVEHVWSYLKINPMANMTPYDLDSLTHAARYHGRSLQRKNSLLRSFVKHSPLFLRLR